MSKKCGNDICEEGEEATCKDDCVQSNPWNDFIKWILSIFGL
jgi:hypothetical protein